LERDGVEAAQHLSQRNAESLLFIALPAAAGLALVAEPIAALMVGAEFRADAAAIIPWMAMAGLLRGLTLHYLHHAFLFSRRTGMLIWLMAIPAGLNLALNLLLIPRFGLDGAIASTILAYIAAFVLSAVVGVRL